jgi:hypothetical protein
MDCGVEMTGKGRHQAKHILPSQDFYLANFHIHFNVENERFITQYPIIKVGITRTR